MIQRLLLKIIERMQNDLGLPPPGDRIVEGPIAPPPGGRLPQLAVYTDALEIDQVSVDLTSSEPRPEEFREIKPVDESNPLGPYPLTKSPLQTSVLCKAVFPAGNGKLLLEGEDKDFTVNYQDTPATVTFNSKPDPETGEETHIVTKADVVYFRYSFAGIFTQREFRQDFLIDVYGADMLEAEKWGALSTALILTRHDELKKDFNEPDAELPEHAASTYSLQSNISNIRFLQGSPDFTGNDAKLQLRFRAQGQLKFIQSNVGNFGVISKIYSPGKTGVPGSVEIDIGLE